jgi:hypothetical protein
MKSHVVGGRPPGPTLHSASDAAGCKLVEELAPLCPRAPCRTWLLGPAGCGEGSFFGHEPLRSTEINSLSMSFLLSLEMPSALCLRT